MTALRPEGESIAAPWRRLAIALACVLVAAPASAVLIASGDGTGNTTAPPQDPGWSHVGAVNGLSGVYLGDGWVLTANHVGTGPITLGGVSYPVVPGSSMRLEHSPGVLTDLLLFQLISDPGLDPLPIAVTSPPLSAEAILIGRGCERGVPYTFSGHPGWRWVYTYTQRWGTNSVSQPSFNLSLSGQPLRAVGFSFDDLGGTAPEAIVTVVNVTKNYRTREYELHLGKLIKTKYWDAKRERPRRR